MATTRDQVKAILAIIETLREAIVAAGPSGIPSGHLYAMVMGCGISLEIYERCISLLVEAGRVKRGPMHLLTAKDS